VETRTLSPSVIAHHHFSGVPLWLASLVLLAVSPVCAQQTGVDLLGSAVPGITALGHHSIGVNPSLLATERPFCYDSKSLDIPDSLSRRDRRNARRNQRLRFFSGFEGSLIVETPLLDGTSLVQWAEGNKEWSLEDRRDVANRLAQSPTRADAALRWAGWSRHGRRGGWAWTVEDRYSASVVPSSALAEFVMLGPASSLYDQVVLMDGTIVGVDSLSDEQFGMVETGLRDDGALLALELLGGSSVAVQHVRSYGAGFGLKLMNTRALKLSIGASIRYLRGTGYYEVNTEEQWAFAAFNRGFGAELVASEATLGSALRPSGFGVALDLAARVEVAELWFASLAVTDIGSMDWQGERYSLNNPVTDFENWSAGGGGVFDLLNEGLAPSALFVEATPERRVVDMPTRVTLNAGMRIGKSQMLGIEIGAPLNDALLKQPAEFGVGGQIRIGPIMGMGGMRWREGGDVRWPLALIWNRQDRPTQFGLATDDVFGWIAPERRWGWGWSLTRTIRPSRDLKGRN